MMIYELESKSPRFHLLKELENEQFQGAARDYFFLFLDVHLLVALIALVTLAL